MYPPAVEGVVHRFFVGLGCASSSASALSAVMVGSVLPDHCPYLQLHDYPDWVQREVENCAELLQTLRPYLQMVGLPHEVVRNRPNQRKFGYQHRHVVRHSQSST